MQPTPLSQGNAALRNKDYEAAIRHYHRALAQNPELAAMLQSNIDLAHQRGGIPKPASSAVPVATVDIVVPVYNALEDVKKCLESLQRCTDGLTVKVIVVNDGSDEATTQWLREYCGGKPVFKLIEHEKNAGYTKAVNTGLKASTAEYAITQNSDTIVSPGWLTGLVRCMNSSPDIGIVGPLSNAASWQTVPNLRDEQGNFAVNELPAGYTVDDMAQVVRDASTRAYPRLPLINGFCFMIKREVITAIGIMDEENFPIGYGEENDYCIRAIEAGYELVIADDVYIFHAKSKSFGHERRKALSVQGSKGVRRKHGSETYSAAVNNSAYNDEIREIRERITSSLQSTRLTHDVIVCVHNAMTEVDLCIRSILKHSTEIQKIIIIDDFSDEKTVRMLELHQKKNPERIYITRTSKQSGYTKAANIGLKISNADIRTLLNSDTIVTANWSTKILSKFRIDKAIGIIGPLSNAASYQSVPSITATSTQTAINGLPEGITPDEINAYCQKTAESLVTPYTPLVHGFCMSIRKQCIEAVGYFDEVNFPKGYGEENDFCIRAQDAGFALAIALDTYIYHAKSKSYPSEQRVQLMTDGWNELVKKHGKHRLQHAIKTMETHPQLALMRRSVETHFYSKEHTKHSLKANVNSPSEFGTSKKLKTIAFYLPQFHPTPENDANWGEGFTEWTNVVKARPRFPEHFQPRLPGKLGFYDLRIPEIMTEQTKLAEKYGISGFCFYYYRFGDKRVLDLPLKSYLNNNEANLPFCYCWANESWTRAWDGKTSDVLFQQDYDEVTLTGYVRDIIQAFSDERYITIEGKPVLIIYQVAELSNPEIIIKDIRRRIKENSGKDVLIGSVFSHNFKLEMLSFLDFVVQFPPHRIPRQTPRVTIKRKDMHPYEPEREDYYEAYDEVIKSALKGPSLTKKMWLGVCPDWDNTSRRQRNATTLVGSTPEKFFEWTTKAAQLTREGYATESIPAPVLFVNAWNEWAEGAVLEPTEKFGYSYLEAFKRGISA